MSKGERYLQCFDSFSMNRDLIFDRHEEATAMEAFARSIKLAGDQTLEDPLGIPLIPNWSRIISALPDLFDLLLEVVEKDNA